MANFNKNAAVRIILMFFVILVIEDEKNTVIASPYPASSITIESTDHSATIVFNDCKTPYNYTVTGNTQAETCYSDFNTCLKKNITQVNAMTCRTTVINLCASARYLLNVNNTILDFDTLPPWPTGIQIYKDNKTESSVSLSWSKPLCPKKTEFRYTVTCRLPENTGSGSSSIQVPLNTYKLTIPIRIPNNIAYTLLVQACFQEDPDYCHEVARLDVEPDQKDPFRIKITKVTKNSATITYSATPFSGNYDRYTLIVGAKHAVDKSRDSPVNATYNESIKWPKPIYITSPLNWNPFKPTEIWDSMNCTTVETERKSRRKCIIGFQTYCKNQKYCNGPLRPNFNYGVKIRGYYGNTWNETDTYAFKTDGSAILKPSLLIFLLVTYVFYKEN